MARTVTKFTGTRDFSVPFDENPCTLIVDAGTGTVVVSVQIDTALDEWITYDTYLVDGVHKVEANGCNVRIATTGDAAAAVVRP